MECPERKIFTTQFHPEVKHSEYGQQLLSNFLFEICGLEPNWSMDNLVETMTAEFREKVGDDRVILALSGGVDSSVVAALGARAVGKQMTCVFVNHGLLRKGEPEQVEDVFTKQFDVDFIHVHAEERYAKLLDGGTCDSVPITYSLLTGRKTHIVVLTQDATYEKGANKLMPVFSQMYADFPHYLERLRYRHVEYNRTYRQVARMHEAGEVFAIQPQRPVEVHSMEHDQDKLLDLYAQGYAEAARTWDDLQEYLAK